MDESVIHFYDKENNPEHYYKKYEWEHTARLNFTVKCFKLDEIKNKTVADFGSGAGFLLSRLDNSNEKHGFDGADIPEKHLLCDFTYHRVDFEVPFIDKNMYNIADVGFCFETLEHIGNPYNLLCEMKKHVVKNGDIYLSIPDERVTHNVVYPALMFPHTNFEEFLLQMALPIKEHVVFEGNWPAQIWKCYNAPWSQKKLKYPKEEEKFLPASPLECTNL